MINSHISACLLFFGGAFFCPPASLFGQIPDLVFPLFVNGEFEGVPNNVRVVLRNNGDAGVNGRILFRDSDGNPIQVSVQGLPVGEVEYDLGPWSTFRLDTGGTGAFQHGVVEVIVESGDPSNLIGTEVLNLMGNFVSVPDAKPLPSVQAYVSREDEERAGIAIYNPSDSADSRVEFILLNKDGQEVARLEKVFLPRGRVSQFVDEKEFFESFFTLNPGPFEGTLNIHVREGPHVSVLGLLQRSSDGALIVVAPSPKAFDTAAAPVSSDGWVMAGANPERTSWTPAAAPGGLKELWVRPIEPYISQKAQVVGADGKVFVSTARGLYAFNAENGSTVWIYPTELPLGHSPTYDMGTLYVGGLDRKLHRIDAKTGQPLWTFEAQGGFQTNPVVAQGKVYLGSRDGFFYGVNAETGQLVWKFKTEGQILQSAAYKSGILYFGSMDGHVYALSGEEGTLVWKSAKLPGFGWRSWWPVLYEDKVILTRTNDKRGGLYFEENDWLFPEPRIDMSVPGVWGEANGKWAPGTPTLDISSNPVGGSIPDYFEVFPNRRNLFVLHRQTGEEIRYDVDSEDIARDAPILRALQDAGTIYPPVVGFDGVLYLRTISNASGAIPGGMAVGWVPGTPYLSYPVSPMPGQSPDWPIDEPTGLSAAGEFLYWNLCCDRFVGSADLSKPNLAFPDLDTTRQWRLVSGTGSPPHQSNSLPSGYHSQWLQYNWSPENPGWYTEHGDNVGPAIYQGRLYVVRSNALIAFSTDGSGSAAPVLPPAPIMAASLPAPALPDLTALQNRLVEEVEKLVNLGHLKPGFGFSGSFDSPARLFLGQSLMDYWHNPGELHYILARSFPHLPTQTRQKLKSYLQEEFEAFPPHQILHVGWQEGAAREPFMIPEDANGREGFFGKLASTSFSGWSFPPHNLYALWKYSEAGLGDPLLMHDLAKTMLVVPVPVSDGYLAAFPHVHNAYIAGYIGFLKLEQLADRPKSVGVEAELERLLALRVAGFTADLIPATGNGKADSYFYTLVTAWNFMYMVPELADHLRMHGFEKVRAAVEKYEKMVPFWFVSHNEEAQNENGVTPIYQSHTLFQAKARILLEPPEVLFRYLDTPVYPVGDLYFIDNLVSLLEAAGPS